MPAKIIITEELKAQVKSLYDQGKGTRTIAKELNLTRDTIKKYYDALGLSNIKRNKPKIKEKECKVCLITKNIDQFLKQSNGRRGRFSYPMCLECHDAKIRNKVRKISKKRTDAGKSKLPENFIEEILGLNDKGWGLTRIKNKLGINKGTVRRMLRSKGINNSKRGTPKRPYLESEKLCKRCGEIKLIAEFELRNSGRGRFHYRYCKLCEEVRSISIFMSDLCCHIKHQVPITIQLMDILVILNYTIEDFKLYIESLFEPWMNWNNHGKYRIKQWRDDDQSTWVWNIDHIIPHSLFKYQSMNDPLFKECWSLNNLRPYSGKQNILDGTRRTRHKVI